MGSELSKASLGPPTPLRLSSCFYQDGAMDAFSALSLCWHPRALVGPKCKAALYFL